MTFKRWRKSTYSGTHQCLEVGRVGDGTAIRDTKDRSAGYIMVSSAQWAAFVDAVKSDRFNG